MDTKHTIIYSRVNASLAKLKQEFDANVQNMINNVDNDIHDTIMKYIGEDLYDYSDVDKADPLPIVGDDWEKSNNKNSKSIMEFFDSIEKQDNGEIVISIKQNEKTGYYNEKYITALTNYGKIHHWTYSMRSSGSDSCPAYPTYNDHGAEFKFWIPKDYCYLLQQLDYGNGLSLGNILKHLKENLYNGRYVKNNVDIQFMDVYQKNKDLEKKKIEVDEYVIEQNNIIDKRFEELQQREEEIKRLEEKQRLIVSKIKMEQIKLESQKRIFEEQVINNVDFDDIIGLDVNNTD